MTRLSARRLRRAIVAAGAVATVAGCGSSASTSTSGAGTSSSGTTAVTTTTTSSATSADNSSATASTTTGGGGPSIFLLHAVSTSAGLELRIATPGGGTAARSVAVLPANSFLWDAGHGRALVFDSGSSSVVVVDVPGGTKHTIAAATGVGGAISPDGTKVAYLAPGTSGGFAVRVTTIDTGSSQTLATFNSGPVPDPIFWGPNGIVADLIVPNADAPTQGLVRIDPSSGSEQARSSGLGQHGVVACGDGDHVVAADHTSGLGDDGDAPPGPGPQGNPNTLRLVAVGGAQVVVREAAHHQIDALSCAGDGSVVLVADGSSVGGVAGISQSPEFGLLLLTSHGTVKQLAHFGPTFESGAVYQDGATVAAVQQSPSGVTLVELSVDRPAVTLDTVAGATGARVYLMSGR